MYEIGKYDGNKVIVYITKNRKRAYLDNNPLSPTFKKYFDKYPNSPNSKQINVDK